MPIAQACVPQPSSIALLRRRLEQHGAVFGREVLRFLALLNLFLPTGPERRRGPARHRYAARSTMGDAEQEHPGRRSRVVNGTEPQ